MPKKIPKPERPLTYEDLPERFELLRWRIYEGLEAERLDFVRIAQRGFVLPERFESDSELRESCAEVLLASILWVEAGRPPKEILQDCAPEIKDQLVYSANTFLEFLRLRSFVQKEATASLGSTATAWIHLFAEFLDELRKDHGPRWWKLQPRKYPS